jgi:integrase
VFFLALRQRKVAVNPCVGVWRPGAPPSRERVLTPTEIVWFWQGCEHIGWPFGPLFKLLLLTGARLGEVTGMRTDELSNDGKVWTVPSTRTKNHLTHEVPLPSLAQELVAELPRVVGDHGLLFTTNGARPVSGFSRAKDLLDNAMAEAAGSAATPWRLHDLRRTCATGMANLGVHPHVVGAALNHISGAKAGVAGTYNRAAYAKEKADALQRWAAHVEGLVSGGPANVVVAMPRRR